MPTHGGATTSRQPSAGTTSTAVQHRLLSVILHRLHAFATTILLYLLSLGPIPRHVGFVMDGNRRYARGRGKRVVEGHTDGFQSLRRILEVCLKLRIRAVSIYAFSIDNFSRSEEEVGELMRLAKTRLMELCEHGDLLQKYEVRIRFIGRREMLPVDVREAVEDMERLTERHTSGVLNVCCPYTSRDEILHAVKRTMGTKGNAGEISEKDLYPHLESVESISALKSASDPVSSGFRSEDLDIFVRTSNVKRLSDFMMWQSSTDTQLHFVRTMWPEFGLTDMLPILLGWQQKVCLARLGQ